MQTLSYIVYIVYNTINYIIYCIGWNQKTGLLLAGLVTSFRKSLPLSGNSMGVLPHAGFYHGTRAHLVRQLYIPLLIS